MKPRLPILDIGRFLAAPAVILHHANFTILHDRFVPFRYGQLGVEFFMILSGYLLALPWLGPGRQSPARFSLKTYLAKRVARIYPAYFVAVAAIGILLATGFGHQAEALAPGSLPWHLFTHFLLIHTWFADTFYSLSSPWWSMSVEWQYYLIFPLLLALFLRVRAVAAMTICLVFALIYRTWVIHAFPDSPRLWMGVFAGRLPEFAFGMGLSSLASPLTSPRKLVMAALGFAGAGALALGSDNGVVYEPGFQFLVIGGFLLLLAAQNRIAQLPARATAWAVYLGQASYSTYLIHTFAGRGLLSAMGRLGWAPSGAVAIALGFVGYLLIAHVAGIAYHATVERPLSAWLGAALSRAIRDTAKSSTPAESV